MPRHLSLILALLVVAPLVPVALGEDASFREDWEDGTLRWLPSGAGARQDCAMGRPGCSLELTQICCDFYARNGFANVVVPLSTTLTRDVDVRIPDEGLRFSFSFHVVRGFDDGATALLLELDAGNPIEIVPYSPWNHDLTFSDSTWAQRDRNFAGWQQGRWYEVVLHIDPVDDLAWVELRDDAGALVGLSSAATIATSAQSIRALTIRTYTWPADLPFAASSMLDGPDVIHYDTLAAAAEPTPPPARVGGLAVASAPSGALVLTWAAAPGAASYRIWRSTGPAWTLLAEVPAATTAYEDADVAERQYYRYRVSARSLEGAEGPASATLSTRTPCRPYPPWWFDVASTPTAAEMEWYGGWDCDSPLIDIVVLRDGVPIASLPPSAWSWSDVNATPGVSHEYAIALRNAVGLGEPTEAVRGGVGGPDTPRDLTGTGRRNAVELAWSPPADTPSPSGYDVRWSGNEWSATQHVQSAAWRHEGVGNGEFYSYVVRAYNDVGRGRWSDEIIVVPTPENPPRALEAVVVGRAVALRWEGPAAPDTQCNTYRVQRSTDLETWITLPPVGAEPECRGVDDALPGAYIDAAPVPGRVNHYRVVATYSSQSFYVRIYEGPPSEVVSVPIL